MYVQTVCVCLCVCVCMCACIHVCTCVYVYMYVKYCIHMYVHFIAILNGARCTKFNCRSLSILK